MKKIVSILLPTLSLIFGAIFFLKSQKEEGIPTLTQEERVLFSKMWETLYFNTNFGYTLIGSKPVSIQNWSKDALNLGPATFSFFLDGRTKELWEQFSKKHPSKHYALIFKEIILPKSIDPDQLVYGEVIFINKAAVTNCFLQHKKLEARSFPDLSPETIAREILNAGDSELTGVLLGYGSHNSSYFQRDYDLKAYYQHTHYFPQKLALNQEEIDLFKDARDFEMTNPIDLDPKDVILELQNRQNTPFKVLDSYIEENPLSPTHLPCFRAEKDHSETLALIEKYQKEQKKIVQFGLLKPLLDSILTVYFFGYKDE